MVSMHEGNLLTFTGKQLCEKKLGKSTYNKEMMDNIHEFETRHSYLIESTSRSKPIIIVLNIL
jgi:hypothetical protein